MRTSDPDYVSGEAGRYLIQPPITHPPKCVCNRCVKLPAGERELPHVFRILRRSPFPDSRVQSAVHASAVKASMERELMEAVTHSRKSDRLSLRAICDLFFEVNPKKVSAATIQRDEISARNICRIIGELAPDVMPQEIDEAIAVRYRNAREKEKAAPRTILNELTFLKRILDFGFRWQRETGMEAVRLIEVPSVDEWDPPGVALTVEEVGKVLSATNPRNRAFIVTGVTTMLRREPLVNMHSDWIDRRRNWLSVPPQFMKKGRSRRRYPLEAPICDTAASFLKRPAPGYYWPSSKTGKPMRWIDHIFSTVIEQTGVRAFSCHDLRTTGSTWLRQAGVDELVIALLMGHRASFDADSGTFHPRSRNVTRGYTKLFETTLREAVAVFDEVLRPIADA